MANKIPDRWIPYKACGRVIDGTRIICFKVPLNKRVQLGNSEIKEIWDVKTLLETIPKLAAVIDLTNTKRYYDPRELQDAGVIHKKIFMPGRVIPPENKVQEFMDAVDEFLGKDCVAVDVKRARRGLSTADSLVGVHCTHGLNRTGYMVCRYMRDRLNIPASSAIKKFEKARGYQIERENYIADLRGEKPPPPYFGDHAQNHGQNSDPWRKSEGSRNSERTEATSWRSECKNGSYEKEGSYSKWDAKKVKYDRYGGRNERNRSDSDRSMDYTFDY